MISAPLFLTAVLAACLVIAAWLSQRRLARLLATVQRVKISAVASKLLENERPVCVFLPPGYDEDGSRRYPVLYLNDGQDITQLGLHQTLAHLFAEGQLTPFITVAVPTNENRLQEYGTATAPNAQGLGERAGQYSRFVTEELRPVIEERFRAAPGPAAILGASLGGLSAFDIAWNHPALFGTVGVFSGSFWWRAADDETRTAPGRRIMHQVVREGRPGPAALRLRAWFEVGTRDETADRDNNGVIDAIQDTLELMEELVALGYREGEELVYVEVPYGRHDYETWARVLPQFLVWAFPA